MSPNPSFNVTRKPVGSLSAALSYGMYGLPETIETKVVMTSNPIETIEGENTANDF
jgi:hypothetical protein